MAEARRSTLLALSLVAGALVLAIVQVGWVMVSDPPASPEPRDVKFRFETQQPERPSAKRETRVHPRPVHPRS